ncbi:MAG: 30S ribosomal protein S12 methylthiotransferase RimO [Candidatus Azotimanducaceae bacterium]
MSTVSYVSLGCPKALVDSEHIVTALADENFEVVGENEDTDVVVVNTCGFINQAKAESYAAIETAIENDQEVVVTGCLGVEREELLRRYPNLKFVSGPGDTAQVVKAVKSLNGQSVGTYNPDLVGRESGNRVLLTPDHYAYLKIAEGCNHKCTFCIIPTMRGPLASKTLGELVEEAQTLVENGVKELLLIAQDLSAYGLDRQYADKSGSASSCREDIFTLCKELAGIAPWLRLHYVYPYPHVDKLIEMMAEGQILPYLDMPLQHASPSILKAMKRPASSEKTLERIQKWRSEVPNLSIRSNFIVGFPGETEQDLDLLLKFLDEAKLDRVGCFTYSEVEGARANELPDPISEREKLDRQDIVYEHQATISHKRLTRHTGNTLEVIIDDEIDGQSVGRTIFDAPDIDGRVFIEGVQNAKQGDFVLVEIKSCDDHDLYGDYLGHRIGLR